MECNWVWDEGEGCDLLQDLAHAGWGLYRVYSRYSAPLLPATGGYKPLSSLTPLRLRSIVGSPRPRCDSSFLKNFWLWLRTCVALRDPTWDAIALWLWAPKHRTASRNLRCSSSDQ